MSSKEQVPSIDAAACLAIARTALAEAAREGGPTAPDDLPEGGPFDVPTAVFVTLRRGAALRGCIGFPEPTLPLAEAVWQAAQMAALSDTRFLPVEESELDALTVEVSLLTPPTPLPDTSLFRFGIDGAVLELDGRRALYLPEVGAETRWALERYFSELSRKAGLPGEAWRDPRVRIGRFQTLTAEGPARL